MSRSHVACNINDYIKDLTILCNKAPVTGRTGGIQKTFIP